MPSPMRITLIAAAALAASACNRNPEPAATPDRPAAATERAAPADPAATPPPAVEPAPRTTAPRAARDTEAYRDEEGIAVVAPAAGTAEPQSVALDVCALLDRRSAEEVTGPLSTVPQAEPADGSVLGGCRFQGPAGAITITARPAAEYDATVARISQKSGTKAVDSLEGEAMYHSATGVFVRPEGQTYFLQVVTVTMPALAVDEARSVEVARSLNLPAPAG